MNKDITVMPYEYIVTFTKTDNIAIRFENGDYICEIQEEHQDLVRCKECKWRGEEIESGNPYHWCRLVGVGYEVDDIHFCSYGERRE